MILDSQRNGRQFVKRSERKELVVVRRGFAECRGESVELVYGAEASDGSHKKIEPVAILSFEGSDAPVDERGENKGSELETHSGLPEKQSESLRTSRLRDRQQGANDR